MWRTDALYTPFSDPTTQPIVNEPTITTNLTTPMGLDPLNTYLGAGMDLASDPLFTYQPAPAPTYTSSKPADTTDYTSSPLATRLQQVLRAIQTSGFPSLEALALHYYTGSFTCQTSPRRRPRRDLGRFLAALRRAPETWRRAPYSAEEVVRRELAEFLARGARAEGEGLCGERLRREVRFKWLSEREARELTGIVAEYVGDPV